MRLHRFYVGPDSLELTKRLWVKDVNLRNQWLKVLRYREGDDLVLFDGLETERLYRISKIDENAICLDMITEFERKLPTNHVYLFFSLMKKDKNDWVLQKGTELGVRNFVPIIASRSEKLGFNIDRASKIVIEASEQCGRSDIPKLREPITLSAAISEYRDKVNLLYADEPNEDSKDLSGPVGGFVGPEGGWTEEEKDLFRQNQVGGLNLGQFILRAETACVVASSKMTGMQL